MPGIVVSVAGLLGDQAATRGDSERISQIIAVNFTGPAVVLEAAAARIGSGWVIGISSVSGDRGRASNYWYGAAKAGLSTMLSGLRQRYAGSNVRVMVVKPGFVATRMTRGMKLIGPLTNTPEEIAALVCKAMDRGREVVYPFRWKLVMLVLRTVPEWIYRRLKL
uniref:Short chain dehydrogenase n=1 Tax=uncultured organism TaxID=155900 RepID=A0A068FQ54_9ZZZZ|nr:short chain dehydrogenase [uncultured organism]